MKSSFCKILPCLTVASPPEPGPLTNRGYYRGTSLIRDHTHLGHYSRTMPMVLRRSKGGGRFFMSEVPV